MAGDRAKRIKVGTDCSGLETPLIALRNLGIEFDHVFSSETDDAAIAMIEANFKPTTLYGDITKRDHEKVEEVDIYCAGAPCQSWSQMGNQGGLSDPRGRVIFESIAYIEAKKPKIWILENVPTKNPDFCEVQRRCWSLRSLKVS